MIAARGLVPDLIEPGATSLVGLRDLVRRLVSHTDHEYASGAITAVDMVYSQYRSVNQQVPVVDDFADRAISVGQFTNIGLYSQYLPDPLLVAGLVSQFAYISLYHAAAESFGSEKASRLVAMDGATRNTGGMVDELTSLERRERQHEITRQMLELAASRLTEERS